MSHAPTHKLALILGSPGRIDGEPGSLDDYQQARYAFDGSFVSGETHFFGKALIDYLVDRDDAPESVLVMGTEASIWNTLVPAFGDLDAHEKLWCELVDEVRQSSVGAEELERLERFLDEQVPDLDFDCRLVAPATDRDEQLDILATLSAYAERGDELTLDVTHGLRSMGYSALAAGQLLHRTRDVEVRDVFYGNFAVRTDDGAATVVRISALDDLFEWASEVDSFRRTGLLGELPELVGRRHPSLETPLARLNHALVTNRFGSIQEKARQAAARLADIEVDATSPFSLFRPDLADELERLREPSLIDLQLDLAERALDHADYLRAAICQFEAVVSAAIEDEDARRKGHLRTEASKFLRDTDLADHDYATAHEVQTLGQLRDVRNAMSHGTRPRSGGAEEALNNNEATERFLRQSLEQVRQIVGDFRRYDALLAEVDNYIH